MVLVTLFIYLWCLWIGMVSAASCVPHSLSPNFVGGGYVDPDGVQLATVSVNDDNTQTTLEIRNASTGTIQSAYQLLLGAIQAITCPANGLIAIALVDISFSDGVHIVQPYIYFKNGTQLSYIFRTR